MTAEIRARIGRPSSNLKGGWIATSSKGYRNFRMHLPKEERGKHPTEDRKGYIARSHFVWNRAHPKDPVQRGEVVHHLNENSLDDRPENLVKLNSQSEHWRRFHARKVTEKRVRDSSGRFF